MICQNCSQQSDEISRFCKYCGAAHSMCQNCQKELDADSKFCKHCGAASSLTTEIDTSKNKETAIDPQMSTVAPDSGENRNAKIFIAVLVIIFGLLFVFKDSSFFSLGASKEKITLAEYNQIEMGMPFEKVRSIVGSDGVELTRTEIAGYTTFIVVWEGVGDKGANANVTFQNNKVIATAQIGLK